MKLKQLEITNFKGTNNTTVEFYDKTLISGKNASGKTTIQDAYTWLLFDKDSQNNSQFSIRPLDKDGNFANLDPVEVTATIELGEEEHTIAKVLKTKVKGETISNTTEYYIDGESTKKASFIQFIAGIIDEDKFKLISNPYYFGTIHWKDQRALLLSLVEKPNYEDLKALLPQYEKQLESLKAKDMESILTDLVQKINKAKKEVETIKNKLSEHIVPPTARLVDTAYQTQQLNKLKLELEEKEKNKTKRIIQINQILATENSSKEKEIVQQIKVYTEEKNFAISNSRQSKTSQETAKRQLEMEIESKSNLTEQWKLIKSKLDTLILKRQENNSYCPTCGKLIDDEEVKQKAKNELMKQIKELDIERERIEKRGRESASVIDNKTKLIEQLDADINDFDQKAALLTSKILECERALEKMMEQAIRKDDLNPYKMELFALESQNFEDEKATIEQLQKELNEQNALRATIERKNELTDQLQKEVDKLNKLEQNQNNYKELESLINENLNKEINSKFSNLKVDLFEKTNSGDIKAGCKVLVNSNGCLVDYNSANTGAKIKAGLEIISKFNQNTVPVWIDNYESIEITQEYNFQQIYLEVVKGQNLIVKEI